MKGFNSEEEFLKIALNSWVGVGFDGGVESDDGLKSSFG